MSMYFRIVLSIMCMVFLSNCLLAEDLLLKNILKYNQIAEKTVKVDSAKIFYNINFTSSHSNLINSTQIIQHRAIQNELNITFFIFLFVMLVFAIFRYYSNSQIADLISDFINLNNEPKTRNSFLRTILVIIAFVGLLSYSIYYFLSKFFTGLEGNFSFLVIVFSVLIILFIKYLIANLVVTIFKLNNKIRHLKYTVINLMYIFVFISLPILTLSCASITYLQKPLLIGIFALYIFLIFVFYVRIYLSSHYLLTRNVFNLMIYFYLVEIIPILLPLKYFKLL